VETGKAGADSKPKAKARQSARLASTPVAQAAQKRAAILADAKEAIVAAYYPMPALKDRENAVALRQKIVRENAAQDAEVEPLY